MIKASEEVYFLMDHHKLASRAFYKVCDLEEITELIVDASEEEYVTEFTEECRKNNKHIHLCLIRYSKRRRREQS